MTSLLATMIADGVPNSKCRLGIHTENCEHKLIYAEWKTYEGKGDNSVHAQ